MIEKKTPTMNRERTAIDVESLLIWAFRDELSKRGLSSAEGIWDKIEQDAQRGGIDPGHGRAMLFTFRVA
jgi:hypothetical protein